MQSGTSRRGISSSFNISRKPSWNQACDSKAVRKTIGEICKGPEETLNHWQENYNSLLNITSNVLSQEVLDDVPQLPLQGDVEGSPSKGLQE